MCCACNGSCMHTGPHHYCETHRAGWPQPIAPKIVPTPPIAPFRIPSFTITLPQGWSCPKCTRVYAPSVTECGRCNAAVDAKVSP